MNKPLLFSVLIIFVLILAFTVTRFAHIQNIQTKSEGTPIPTSTQTSKNSNAPTSEVIAKNLEIPWGIAFLSDGKMLFTERVGRVRLIDEKGTLQENPVSTISDVKVVGEGGLLGIAVHPNFNTNHFVYLYYTYSSSGNNTLNQVVRYKYEGNVFSDAKVILDKIPGSSNHDGGRIKFGPDNLLYITTGDAENPSQSQSTTALGGKILRITDEGQIPANNPFKNPVYSYGHRNPQGLAWNTNGDLFETEHGPSGGTYGTAHDEFNFIEKGKNYGWPVIIGDDGKDGMEMAILNSGSDTWAPSGMAFTKNAFFFGALKGQALMKVTLEGGPKLTAYFKNEFGRIRDVVLGPDNMLYITTSNRDGRGNPTFEDDRIIRVNPEKL